MSKSSCLAIFLLLATAFVNAPGLLRAQTTATPPAVAPNSAAPSTYTSDLGFVYDYPADWEVVDSKPIMPMIHLQGQEKATSDEEKKAAACLQVGLLARHGNPSSILVVVGVPFACLGSDLKVGDLAGFGLGVSTGMNRSFDLKDPSYGAYKLGSHSLWIERAKGAPKTHPESTFTIDTVCLLLSKGAVCWVGMMKDDAAVKAFEQTQVAIEGEAAQTLVPPGAIPGSK